MKIISNDDIAAILTTESSIDVMRAAFRHYASAGAMQERVRIDSGAVKLSMMGAILPGIEAAGAKIYTTIGGQFRFVILLFSASSGALLAVMEGDAMTAFRTAAVTAIATDALALPEARTLALFGTGVQARAHVPALLAVRQFTEIVVVGIEHTAQMAADIATLHGVRCRVAEANDAVAQADVIVTATRSPQPLFDGRHVKPGAFVAAIGSSKPDAREIDDALIARAGAIVVEWLPQARREAGDLLLCPAQCMDWDKVLELGTVLTRAQPVREDSADIIVYKGIGVGVEDVALAEYVYRRLAA